MIVPTPLSKIHKKLSRQRTAVDNRPKNQALGGGLSFTWAAKLLFAAAFGFTPSLARADEDYSQYSPATAIQIRQIHGALGQYLQGSHGFGIDTSSLRNMHITENFSDFLDVEGNLTFSNGHDEGSTGALKAEFRNGNVSYLSICDYHGLCDSWNRGDE